MNETMQLANSWMMWILAILIVATVMFQSFIFYRLARNHVNDTQLLSDEEVKKAFKIGVIGTIGPAFAVFAVAIALISRIGGPITLARIGIIGSAAFEIISAQIGSGGTAGTPEFMPKMLSAAAWVMTLGGAGWLIVVFFATKRIDGIQEKMKKANPLTIAYMSIFAPFIIFFTLGYKEVINKGFLQDNPSIAPMAALIAGAISTVIINKIVEKDHSKKWLKEWSMGFSVIAAMIVGGILS
ncbi:DUF5058 family protein [Facklamia sp. 7083-14-GEN3]|uniref:DUF5058 family protein n=1 Tax=Facklamia sp. 7083-14-GEN3 TaxID=2973478 RepID=UPI00215BE4F4|nr:DUF5058 family protein [Facklamia sp. 7083-14-GEN3]MCR8969053.1 DUF5058 family protein [Facklamia sp. 7083-14-GEN3]